MDQPEISIVIPLYNEQDSIVPLYQELTATLNNLNMPYEVIVVDDGSTDLSFARLCKIHEADERWKIVQFRRNYGQTAGFSVGFNLALGATVITIDADLQNNPQDIPRLLAKIEEGYDIVSGWRVNRQEPFFSRRLPSILANGLISRVSGVELHDYGCTLKAYRSEIVKNIQIYGELHRFIPAVASSLGIRTAEIPVDDRMRRFGKSKYGIWRTFRVVLDIILVRFLFIYGTRPIQVFGGIGLVMGSIGFIVVIMLVYVKLVMGEQIGDRPLLLLAILLIILGVQMVSIGLIGEIVMRIYQDAQSRPRYMTRERLGFED
jgi:glycosyltransferase involved in cell wall biosynthesis